METYVEVEAVVIKVLRDDTVGSRHQRFIVRLEDDTTRLVVHNIDLSPRVPLDEGDTLRIKAAWIDNDLGGIYHRTHRDPQRDDPDGWIDHKGRRYE